MGWLPSSLKLPRTLSVADIDEVRQKFSNAAYLCQQAGFDAIELHCGHGYLLSQFLTPLINRRGDRYGGSVAGRATFPRETLEAIKRVTPNLPVIVKMNLEDGISEVGLPRGLALADSIETALIFARAGADAIVPSYGYTSLNGFGMLRGNVPLDKMVQNMPGGAGTRWILEKLGSKLVPQIEYEPLFLREKATKLLEALRGDPDPNAISCKVLYIGGADSLSGIESLLRDGFDGVQLARPLIREPFFVRRLKRAVKEREATNSRQAEGIDLIMIASDQHSASTDRAAAIEVKSRCIRCNLCTLASLNEAIKPGCVFLKSTEYDIEELPVASAARL